jgi:hypothetical protein
MRVTPSPSVRLRPGAWSAWTDRLRLGRVEEQAELLGLSKAQLYRILNGTVAPGEQFIAACMAKYDGKFEELFEVVQ